MSEYGWLSIYCLLILTFSVLGGFVPFLGRITHSRLQFYLSLSAGFMLGAAIFHVMPDAMEMAGDNFGWWMSLGMVGLFCIERFIAPHSHEMDGGGHQQHGETHQHHDKQDFLSEHGGGHQHAHPVKVEHSHSLGAPEDQRAAAPAVAGWMAVLGLTIHTLMNGVGLAGEVEVDLRENHLIHLGTWTVLIPGIAMFLAIFFHKPADALAISTVLSRKGIGRWPLFLVQVGFAAMVAVGAVAFCLTHGAIGENLRSQLTGAALAFSAGTFLFVALSDLLPEVQFHRHDRFWLFLALVSGVAIMGGIALLEKLGHGEH